MKKILMILALISGQILTAQTVTGNVKDESGAALPGVNVIIKNTSMGVVTDFDGNYSIDVDLDTILVFSYIGYTSQEVVISGQDTVNITLLEGVLLEEIVMTGSRTPARSNTDSPLPIDVVGVKELTSTCNGLSLSLSPINLLNA